MGQLAIRKFTATGAAINLNLGFIPAYALVINDNAADTEIWKLEYLNQFGDAKELWHYMINNDGGDDVDTPVKKSSGGYIAEYDSTTIALRPGVAFDYTGGAAEDLFTCSNAAQVPADNDKVKFVAGGGLATGLSALLNYWVINSGVYGAGTFQISLTKGGTAVEMTSDGTPPNYFINLSQLQPVVAGGKGITISASFAADGDVLHVIAWEADTEFDLGDAADW
jgi:hypothetical protein